MCDLFAEDRVGISWVLIGVFYGPNGSLRDLGKGRKNSETDIRKTDILFAFAYFCIKCLFSSNYKKYPKFGKSGELRIFMS